MTLQLGLRGLLILISTLTIIIFPSPCGSRALGLGLRSDSATTTTNNSAAALSNHPGCNLFSEKLQKEESIKVISPEEKGFLTFFHRVFDVSNGGIVPGIIYQVHLEIPPGYEFSLEHWGLTESHVKHRHGREKRRDFIEIFPKTMAGIVICPNSKNTFAGQSEEKIRHLTFDWFVTKPTILTPAALPTNVVFRLRLRRVNEFGSLSSSSSFLEQSLNVEVKPNCNLHLRLGTKTKLALEDFTNSKIENVGLNCTVVISPRLGFGLEARMTNLSIYGVRGLCKTRFLSLTQIPSESESESSSKSESEFSATRTYIGENVNKEKFCGKIEDFSFEETILTFENSGGSGVLLSLNLPGGIEPRESFSLVFNPLSPCQKVWLTELSGSLKYVQDLGESNIPVANAEDCSIVIHVPYGNTVNLRFFAGDTSSTTTAASLFPTESDNLFPSDGDECISPASDNFLQIQLSEDDMALKIHWCIAPKNQQRNYKSKGNRIRINFELKVFHSFSLFYDSAPIPGLTQDCGTGQLKTDEGGCVWLVEKSATWVQAEQDCVGHGGHLASIQNEGVELLLQKIIIESALFHPSRAYWIGANDRESEGNFQWTSALPFGYTNWFPGWSHKGTAEVVNAQPNDDGLSGQDCVELRQQFGSPMAASSFHSFHSQWSKIIFPDTSSSSLNSVNPNLRSTTGTVSKKKEKVYWNDRNCQVKNFYLCEKVKQPTLDFVCNQTIGVGPSQVSPVTFTSPTYPSSYPDNILCFTTIQTLPGYQIVVNFDEFALEDSPSCKYDALEIREEGPRNETQSETSIKRICGNWNKRLKLLRYVSTTTKLSFKFESDFSHHFPGFKAHVWIQKDLNEQCQDQHMHSFGVFCYLFVSFPAVNWKTAQQVCSSLKGNLASVSSSEEWNFVTSTLVASRDYDKKSIYWLGGSIDPSSQLVWADQMPFNFSAFHPSDLQSISDWKCLSMYWHEGGSGVHSWRLSDCAQHSGYICKKNAQVERKTTMNRTFSGTGGKLSSPAYPSNYYNNGEYTSRLIAPEGTQIVLRFIHLDIETQEECLYDWVEIIDRKTRNSTRYCGTHLDTELTKLDFVSSSNEVDVTFHSDFSETLSGYELIWRAVDVTSCLSGNRILTGLPTGRNDFSFQPATIHTPNFPDFNLPGLNCAFTIVAPAGQRIWLHLEIFEIGIGENRDPENCNPAEDHVTIELDESNDISPVYLARKSLKHPQFQNQHGRKEVVTLCGNLTAYPHLTTFISYHEKLQIRVFSPEGRTGRGFLGKFKAIPANLVESISIGAEGNVTFPLKSLNYPLEPPILANLTFAFTSPANYILSLRVVGDVYPDCHKSEGQVRSSPYLEVHDPYAPGGPNGTTWIICEPTGVVNKEKNENGHQLIPAPAAYNSLKQGSGQGSTSLSNVVVFRTSFNRLEVTQVYPGGIGGIGMNRWSAEIVTSLDENFRAKVLAGGDRLLLLNACSPNPCANGGKCVTDGDKHICRCQPPFTGPFCGLSLCDLNPCLFGECLLEETTYRCVCQLGYGGERCDRRSKPCDEKPCTGHGECIEMNNVTYRCLCHAFWEGPRCETRMQRIPYRPLSERMLREPFWLGIITVAVVLLFITLVWCLKRHFPEKLEKLLNDDFDRNRGISWVSGRSPSSFRLAGGALGVREPIPSTSGQQAVSPQTSRSFLGRLGIRKPSLLSISSATSVSVTATSPHTYENRTFSLDDLLRPSRSSMMRTPSPHRRRNFSIHVRRDPSEKQQILQQLVSSGNSQSLDGASKPSTPKPTIAEIIQMSEKRLRLASASSMASAASSSGNQAGDLNSPSGGGNDRDLVETSFINSAAADAAAKAEKKVTFARLMDKLAATEMSSSSSCSDCSCGEEKVTVQLMGSSSGSGSKALMTKKDRKGRFRRSKAYTSRGRNSETDQDGMEMSSSDTTPDPVYPPRFPSRAACASPTALSVSPVGSPNLKLGAGKSHPKMASADSLLALFRRFSGSSSAPPSPQYSENEESSAGATPGSTPSSPRNSALSLNFRPPPAFHITTPEPNHTIEVPVIDNFGQSNAPMLQWSRGSSGQSSSIMLEVPMRDYCLSPIHEVPTPIGTPMHSPCVTPMMQRPQRPPAIRIQGSSDVEHEEEEENQGQGQGVIETGFPSPRSPTHSNSSSNSSTTNSGQRRRQSVDMQIPSIQISSGDDERSREEPYQHRRDSSEVIPDVLVHVPPEEGKEDEKDSDGNGTPRSPRVKTKPPPLVFAANILSYFNKDGNDRDRRDENPSNMGISIPILNVECATPTTNIEKCLMATKSPGISKLPDVTTSYHPHANPKSPNPWENSEFTLAPPMITINQSSEAESDSDTPVMKLMRRPNLAFLSPFACNSERVPSESNLSTSGYSSMASPCPSRCPSVSPLCQFNDTDEFHIHGPHCYGYIYGHGSRRSSLTPASSRRSSLTGRRCSLTGTLSSPLVSNGNGGNLMSANNMAIFSENLEDMRAQQLKDRRSQHDIDAAADSAIEVEAEHEPEPDIPEEPNMSDISEELQDLLQVPRKNLPKSRSFDVNTNFDAVNVPEYRNRYQRLKGESLDSKLDVCAGAGTDANFSSILEPKDGVVISTAETTTTTAGNLKGGRLSPVSSRSDSPISEIGGTLGASPVPGGCGPGLTSPWTDSDCMYDCASSEVPTRDKSGARTEREKKISHAHAHHLSLQQELRRSGRRRDRRMSAGTGVAAARKPASPAPEVKPPGGIMHLDLPPAMMVRDRRTGNLRTSPKRRTRAQPNLDLTSSSSSDCSIRSPKSRSNAASPIKDLGSDKSSRGGSPTPTPNSGASSPRPPASSNISHEELSKVSTSKEAEIEYKRHTLPKAAVPTVTVTNPKPKISRLRTISLQIRFLRRLEQSLIRKRETIVMKKAGSLADYHRDSLLSRSESTSSGSGSGNDSRTDDALLEPDPQEQEGEGSGTESLNSFQQDEPLFSKSLRNRKKPKIVATTTTAASPTPTQLELSKAKKKRLRQYKSCGREN